MVASCTPCDESATVSLSGQRVAAMRRRRSTSASSGALNWKGRIAMSSVVLIGESPSFDGWVVGVSPAAAAPARCADSRLAAPTAAEPARTLRRVGGDVTADMIVLPGGKRAWRQVWSDDDEAKSGGDKG